MPYSRSESELETVEPPQRHELLAAARPKRLQWLLLVAMAEDEAVESVATTPPVPELTVLRAATKTIARPGCDASLAVSIAVFERTCREHLTMYMYRGHGELRAVHPIRYTLVPKV